MSPGALSSSHCERLPALRTARSPGAKCTPSHMDGHFFPEAWSPGGPLASGWLGTQSVWPPPVCPKRWMQDGVPVCSELRRPSGHVFWSSFLPPRPATAPAMLLRPRQPHLGATLWPLGGASVPRRLQGPRSREGRVPGQGRVWHSVGPVETGKRQQGCRSSVGVTAQEPGRPRRAESTGRGGAPLGPGRRGEAAPRGPRPPAAGPARQPCDRAGILGWRPVLLVY